MLDTIKAEINVSEELQIIAATLLPIIELTLGVILLLRIRVKEALIAVTILFLFFFLFSVYGIVLGAENDCGCFESIITSEISIWMLIRNFCFLLIALAVLIKELKALAPGGKNINK